MGPGPTRGSHGRPVSTGVRPVRGPPRLRSTGADRDSSRSLAEEALDRPVVDRVGTNHSTLGTWEGGGGPPGEDGRPTTPSYVRVVTLGTYEPHSLNGGTVCQPLCEIGRTSTGQKRPAKGSVVVVRTLVWYLDAPHVPDKFGRRVYHLHVRGLSRRDPRPLFHRLIPEIGNGGVSCLFLSSVVGTVDGVLGDVVLSVPRSWVSGGIQ